MAMMSLKGCFMFITFFHLHLMVASSHIQLSEIFSTSKFIQYFINDRHRKSVLNSDVIEFPIINTKTPSAIFLLN
ncbi:hypothetical protein SEVIR_2G197401v4 [Setaria viridis]|uniref:Uncharacterized protein n=1 Tax=Setaria viridis TaxID=4556 RepID=A0A4U6VU54_SETVI|nr:hypothetical protein SEVIR_2G197401v2 [Setaria viridis]